MCISRCFVYSGQNSLFFVEVTETETESRPKWRLLTTLRFVHNKFISLNQSFMQKIGTR